MVTITLLLHVVNCAPVVGDMLTLSTATMVYGPSATDEDKKGGRDCQVIGHFDSIFELSRPEWFFLVAPSADK